MTRLQPRTATRLLFLSALWAARLSLAAAGGCPVSSGAGGAPCPFSKAHKAHATKKAAAAAAAAPPPMSPARSAYKTGKGCTCSSECGAGLGGSSYATCDWCWTQNKCGTRGLRGYWDYCVYPQMDAFEAQAHDDKLAQLWAKVTAPDVVGQSAKIFSLPVAVTKALAESMRTTFDDHWEVFPLNRSKAIHTQGVHCQFELAVDDKSPFTGILAAGTTSTGILRMGNAMDMSAMSFPGMGIKFLRTGVKSANFVTLREHGATSSNWNYFGAPQSNNVSPPDVLVRTHKFQQATGCISRVGLSDLCAYDQAGRKATPELKFPYELIFYPTGQANFSDAKKGNAQLLSELASIPAGTQLYDVVAFDSPTAKADSRRKTQVGTLTTTTACHPSLFGDEQLFFRHQRMEEDFAAEPEWIEGAAALGDENCKATVGPISKWQCAP
jgi:hypothetical protein